MKNSNQIISLIQSSVNQNVKNLSPLSGGSISSAYKVDLSDGRTVFVKISPRYDDMFTKEANGLQELQKANAIRTPEIIFVNTELLILEFLPAKQISHRKDFFELFGKQFAQLHKFTGEKFGFLEDNYIGSTPQKNLPQSTSWKEFFFVNRLEFQFNLAEQNGYRDKDILYLFKNLEKRIDSLIPDDGKLPSLLHGDLWSGNYLCIDNSVPAIIDPAVYYGHREADLAMTMLFGGFGEAFYASYQESHPLNEDWEHRMELYKLYHLFNHLNLFGEGYYSQVYDTLRRLMK